MKKVRYLLGTAGLAPAAAGMIIPAAAQAAPAAGHAASGKTVSTYHAGVVRGGCTGHTGRTIPQHHNLKGKYWYTQVTAHSVCIGTVKASMRYTRTVHKCEHAYIFHGGNLLDGKSWCATGTAGHWLHRSLGFHKVYAPTPIDVCLTSTYSINPGTCRSVR